MSHSTPTGLQTVESPVLPPVPEPPPPVALAPPLPPEAPLVSFVFPEQAMPSSQQKQKTTVHRVEACVCRDSTRGARVEASRQLHTILLLVHHRSSSPVHHNRTPASLPRWVEWLGGFQRRASCPPRPSRRAARDHDGGGRPARSTEVVAARGQHVRREARRARRPSSAAPEPNIFVVLQNPAGLSFRL